MGPAGSWMAVSLTGLAGCVGDGGGGCSSVWQTRRRMELGERPGTGSGNESGGGGGGGSILVERWLARAGAGWATPATDREEITQSDALRHTPVEEPAEGRSGRGGFLKSRRCLRRAFK